MTMREIAITTEEYMLVRKAAALCANSGPEGPSTEALQDLAAQWRAVMPADLPTHVSPGERLVETYILMYQELEEEGGIDSWGGSESKSVLTTLALVFPREEDRWAAVREALDVASDGATSPSDAWLAAKR